MPQSARILTTARPKPAVPPEVCQRDYGNVTRSASPQRSSYSELSSFPPSWALYRKQINLLERFHQRCLCSILDITWQGYESNEEVLKRAAQHRVQLVSDAAALGWPYHKDVLEAVLNINIKTLQTVKLSDFFSKIGIIF